MQTSKIRSWVTLNASSSIARCEKTKWFENRNFFKKKKKKFGTSEQFDDLMSTDGCGMNF